MSVGAWILEYIIQTWWFWACVLIVAAVTVFNLTDAYCDGFESAMLLFISLLLVGGIVWPLGCLFWNVVLPHTDETSRHDLLVVRDQTSVSGSFVLGSGNIEGVPAFSFYTQGNGYNQFQVLKAPTARVYQDLKPGETPWMVTFDGCNLWGAIATCFYNSRVINEIHVPPDTIKPTLELDAK